MIHSHWILLAKWDNWPNGHTHRPVLHSAPCTHGSMLQGLKMIVYSRTGCSFEGNYWNSHFTLLPFLLRNASSWSEDVPFGNAGSAPLTAHARLALAHACKGGDQPLVMTPWDVAGYRYRFYLVEKLRWSRCGISRPFFFQDAHERLLDQMLPDDLNSPNSFFLLSHSTNERNWAKGR